MSDDNLHFDQVRAFVVDIRVEQLEQLASRSIAGLPNMNLVYPFRGEFNLDRSRD